MRDRTSVRWDRVVNGGACMLLLAVVTKMAAIVAHQVVLVLTLPGNPFRP